MGERQILRFREENRLPAGADGKSIGGIGERKLSILHFHACWETQRENAIHSSSSGESFWGFCSGKSPQLMWTNGKSWAEKSYQHFASSAVIARGKLTKTKPKDNGLVCADSPF